MKQKILHYIQHPLISGSAIVFAGSMAGNVFHFLFNLFMSRNLTVSDYGILISLMTIASFPGFFLSSIGPTTVNFATTFITNNEFGKLKGLYIKITKLLFFSGILSGLFFVLFADQISSFLHIEDIRYFVWLLGGMVLFGLLGSTNSAFLQAKLSFKFAAFISFLGGMVKFITAAVFVLIGFRVGGVLVALIITSTIVYIVGFVYLRPIFSSVTKTVKIGTKEILTFGAPATMAYLSITSFINTDIILVKHFFSPQEAGLYAGLSLIGKVIFYFSFPIGSVMFPLAVTKHTLGEKMNKILIASIGLVLIPSLMLTIFYFVFPDFTVKFFLKKDEYLAISNLLGFFGIYMSLYSLLHILTNFYLSIKKTHVYVPLFIGALIQIVLILIYHQTLLQIIIVSNIITFLLVLGLLLYYPHATKKRL